MNFQTYTTTWQNEVLVLKAPGSQDTMKSHLRVLNLHLGTAEIDRIDNRTLKPVFMKLSQQLAPKSVRNVWLTLHNVLVEAKRDGYLSTVPDKPQMPNLRRQPQPWYTGEEMAELIKTLASPHKELVALLAETGLRIGEAQGLRVRNVRDSKITVEESVHRTEVCAPKTDTSFRTIAISAHLNSLLKKLIAVRKPDDFIFEDGAYPSGWQVTQRRYLRRVTNRQFKSFHAFRRGNQTLMRDLGVPANIRDYRQGHGAKGGGMAAIYDYTQGLTSREQEEDRKWAEKLAAVLYPGCTEDLHGTLISVLQKDLQFTRREAKQKVERLLRANPNISSIESAIPMLFQQITHSKGLKSGQTGLLG
jgi:integrase